VPPRSKLARCTSTGEPSGRGTCVRLLARLFQQPVRAGRSLEVKSRGSWFQLV